MIGNGEKWTYFSRLIITGDEAIPNVDTIVNKTNFALLTFSIIPDGLLEFDEDTGIFTFLRRGLLDISGILNIQTTTGNTEIEVVPEYNDGGGWTKLSARTAELPVVAAQQSVLTGKIAEVLKGDLLRFIVRSPDASASFKTDILPNLAVVPAGIVHFVLWVR